jgi:hypothetical protein
MFTSISEWQKKPTVIYNRTIMLKACFKFYIFKLESHESFYITYLLVGADESRYGTSS